MATKTETPTEATPLTDTERTKLQAMYDAAQAVRTSVVDGSMAALADTLDKVLLLAPSLATMYATFNKAWRTRRTEDLGSGGFHSQVTTEMAKLGTETKPVVWPLDAAQTWAAKNYTGNKIVLGAYRAKIAANGGTATWDDYATFSDRYALGHYDRLGKLTDKGKAYDDDQREQAFKARTAKIDGWEEIDWSNFLPEDASDADTLAFFKMIAHGATAYVAKRERQLERTKAGKAAVREARKAHRAALGKS